MYSSFSVFKKKKKSIISFIFSELQQWKIEACSHGWQFSSTYCSLEFLLLGFYEINRFLNKKCKRLNQVLEFMLLYLAAWIDLPFIAVRSISQLELFVKQLGSCVGSDVHMCFTQAVWGWHFQQRPELGRSDRKMYKRLEVLTRELIVLCVSASKGNTQKTQCKQG